MAKQDDQHLKLLLEILIEEFPQHEELKKIKKHLLKLPIPIRLVLESVIAENNERWLNRMKGKY